MTRDRADGPPRTALRRGIDWLLVNRATGQITLGQFPNWSIILFLVAAGLAWLLPGGAGSVASLVATGALSWWALDELFCGVNPSRRMLGAAALLAVIGGAVAAILA